MGIYVNEAVEVCLGANASDGFWIGYLRIGAEEKQTELSERVIAFANTRFNMPLEHHGHWTNPPYYKYKYRTDITYANCHEDTIAHQVADELLEMRDRLAEQLPTWS